MLIFVPDYKPKHDTMKRLSLAVVFACCTLVLTAQNAIRVNFQGAAPSISDLAWAFLSSSDSDDEEEGCADESANAVRQALMRYREGTPQPEGQTLTVDRKNGFVLYESRYDDQLLRIEMCYWNEADGKHRLFAYSVACFSDGKYSAGQFDGLTFCRYDNATKTMTYCEAPGFDVEYLTASYALPRTGKDITVTRWKNDGTHQQSTLKWNGRVFTTK
jgi:hypothetical protein